jgi:hypothetical protein
LQASDLASLTPLQPTFQTVSLGTRVHRLSVEASHSLRSHNVLWWIRVSGRTHPSSPGRRMQCPYSFCSGRKEIPTNSLPPTIESWSVPSPASNLGANLTAGCIDTGLPAGRRNFGQSVKTLIETANVHHARWVMFTETRCSLSAYARHLRPKPQRLWPTRWG